MTPADLAELLKSTASAVLTEHGLDTSALPVTVTVERPRNPEHGDYATNIALQLSKKVGANPRELAGWLADALANQDGIASADVAGPGFVNLRIEASAQGVIINNVINAGPNYGGSEELKGETLPRIVSGDLHVCFGVTEPGAGLDTSRITTSAKREGDNYRINGRKVWISKALESEKILLLTRTTPYDEVTKKTDGMTLFLTDLDRDHVDIRPINKMGRNAVSSNEVFIDDLIVPVEDRVGDEGKGFKYILDGLNPERMLIAAEALGIGRVALEKAVKYGNERVVFNRPIGMNQGLQFPLADSLARLDAAELVLRKASWLYDNGKPCGREANTAKYLCADAGFGAADRALQLHGGMGYAEEYNVSRYFRESRLMKIAPVSQEMILNFLGEHVLGLPRSY